MSSYEVPEPIVTPPSATGEFGEIAVTLIDQRGNELFVVKSLKEAEK